MSDANWTQLVIDVAEIKNNLVGVWKRIDEQMQVAQSVQDLTLKVELQGAALNSLVKKLTELVDDIKTIKEKPAKRWDAILSQIINIIVVAVLGIILAKIGLK